MINTTTKVTANIAFILMLIDMTIFNKQQTTERGISGTII